MSRSDVQTRSDGREEGTLLECIVCLRRVHAGYGRDSRRLELSIPLAGDELRVTLDSALAVVETVVDAA